MGRRRVLGLFRSLFSLEMEKFPFKVDVLGINRQYIAKDAFQSWMKGVKSNSTLLHGMPKSLYFSEFLNTLC